MVLVKPCRRYGVGLGPRRSRQWHRYPSWYVLISKERCVFGTPVSSRCEVRKEPKPRMRPSISYAVGATGR